MPATRTTQKTGARRNVGAHQLHIPSSGLKLLLAVSHGATIRNAAS